MDNTWTNEHNPFQSWKVLAWYDRMKAIKNGNFAPPVNIALDPIQGTPNKKVCGGHSCNFCMSDLDNSTEARIPHDVLLSMPSFFSEWGVKSLCIAGHNSDPLMYDHDVMCEFLKRCHGDGLDVGFVSNGASYSTKLLGAVASYCKWSGWSVNAGFASTYRTITGTDKLHVVVSNMIEASKLGSRVGFKFLITDDNYREIGVACGLARNSGATHFQVRPCELPKERSDKIDVEVVEGQLSLCMDMQEDNFGVYGVGEKFTAELTKMTPKRCVASPLGSTWMADGRVVICPDRRWDRGWTNFLCDEGLDVVRDMWGGALHKGAIRSIDTDDCIRCTAYRWHEIYENVIEEDNVDVALI